MSEQTLEGLIQEMRNHAIVRRGMFDASDRTAGLIDLWRKQFEALSSPPSSQLATDDIEGHGNARCVCGHLSSRHACDHETSDYECSDCGCEHFRARSSPPSSERAAEDGGVAETERLHSADCRRQEARRQREAAALEAPSIERAGAQDRCPLCPVVLAELKPICRTCAERLAVALADHQEP